MIKNALILLQQQTKTAVDELLKRIDTQHKERYNTNNQIKYKE
jgi:hypothetical protein